MKLPESWLRTFCNPALSSAELAHLLTMSGLEVEAQEPAAPPFTQVVVAEILAVARHPDADRLNICKVDIGETAPVQIVCGAPNAVAGLKVPCALPGAVLPGNFMIKAAKVRGVESAGMLCSAKELGMSEDASGLLVLSVDLPVGKDLRVCLDLDDQLLTLKLTPNRSDCLGITGIARELAALTGAPLCLPKPTAVVQSIKDRLTVKVSAPELCGRFSGRVIRGVDARASTPDWMKERLARCGQRSISALVDISNYVMLEINRPNHIFDLEKIRGDLEVRWAKAGEKLLLLNGQVVDLDKETGIIAAANGVESLAGIMGGEATAVSDSTTSVYVEAAFWFPEMIAGRSKRYGFASEAGHRFERGVDFADTVAGVERVSELILQICGGQAGPVDDQVLNLPERNPVRLRARRAARLIGVAISADEIADIFTRLEFPFVRDGEDFNVTPPSWRFDLEIEEDLVEEIARVYGYDNIPAPAPHGSALMLPETESSRSLVQLKNILVDRGLQEVINYAFVDESREIDFAGNEAPVFLSNPIASQMNVMRSTLIGGLVEALSVNLRRRENRVRIFEVGDCFYNDTANMDCPVKGFTQPRRLAALLYGDALPEQWGVPGRNVDFFDGKGLLEGLLQPRVARYESCQHPALHPGRSARVLLEGHEIGVIGELHPQWVQKYDLALPPVVFELDVNTLLSAGLPRFEEVSKFPPAVRDISILVDAGVAVQALLDALAANAPDAVVDIRLFDQYLGKGVAVGQKSLAFRVVMQDTQRTLLDAEVDEVVGQLVDILARGFGAQLRS